MSLNIAMQVERIPGDNYFLTYTPSAVQAIHALGLTKPQGWFRIRCIVLADRTDIEFAWDDQATADDFLIPIPNTHFELIMDAVSISYILDEYKLSHDGIRFILSKNPAGALRHQK